MPSKTAIYLPDLMIEQLEARERDESSRSGLLARIVDRYAETVRRELPDLEVGEWKLLCDSLNGVIHEPAGHVGWFAAGVEDSIRLDKLDEKWKVDGKALIRKLSRMSFAQSLAVVDTAERYWAAVSRDEDPKVPGE